MKHYLLFLLLFCFGNAYSSDSLEMARASNNYVEIDLDDNCLIYISDSILKQQTLEAIGKKFQLGWTAKEIKNARQLRFISINPKEVDFILRNPEAELEFYEPYDYSNDLKIWLNELNRLGNARAEIKLAKAKKTDKAAKLQDFKPWYIVYYAENHKNEAYGLSKPYGHKAVIEEMPIATKAAVEYFAVPPPVEKEEPVDPNEPLTIVDESPEFPGGRVAMNEFLVKNLVYPQVAVETEREGRVYIKMVVRKSGELTDIKIIKKMPDCPECDQEALRLIKLMPKWTPAKNNGQVVDCYWNIPVTFKLQ